MHDPPHILMCTHYKNIHFWTNICICNYSKVTKLSPLAPIITRGAQCVIVSSVILIHFSFPECVDPVCVVYVLEKVSVIQCKDSIKLDSGRTDCKPCRSRRFSLLSLS